MTPHLAELKSGIPDNAINDSRFALMRSPFSFDLVVEGGPAAKSRSIFFFDMRSGRPSVITSATDLSDETDEGRGWLERNRFRAANNRTYVGGLERGERNLSLQSVERIAESIDVDALSLLQSHD